MDLSKAFDKVLHNLLLLKLNDYGISGPLLSWFQNYLTDRHQRVVLDGVYSKWLPITSGVPQGSILGPLLFLVYVNDVPNYIRFQSTIALFADDWGMEFNKSKCQVLHVSKRKYSQTFPPYELDGYRLECLPQVKDLGVIVSSDLTWSKHIEVIVAKANKTLGLIKRLLKDTSDLKVRKILYCTLVRPILEYACNLWSPYTAKHRKLIENVQRGDTKFILNYPQDLNYADRLIKIKMLPLEFRRDISDLCLVFKSRNGAITTDVNNFINTYKPGYKSRNYDENNYNLILKHRQDYFRNSFFIRSVELWSSLPSHVKSSSTFYSFKGHLHKLYLAKLMHYVPPG